MTSDTAAPTLSEAERAKSEEIVEIALVAHRTVSEIATAEEVLEFTKHYFRHADAQEMTHRRAGDLAGLIRSHYDLANRRAAGETKLRIFRPNLETDGFTSSGTVVVQIVTDDRPFIIDTLAMEIVRQQWSIIEIYHPQFQVVRDHNQISTIVSRTGAAEKHALAESWVSIELIPPLGEVTDESALADGLRSVLDHVQVVVDDWQKMREKANLAVEIIRSAPAPVVAQDREAAAELMQWLIDEHYTFLGYREYRVKGSTYVPVPGTGLGTLKSDKAAAATFHAKPFDDSPAQFVFTKDSKRATVHRAAYQDYVAVRLFDETGTVIGEHRFLGLLSTSAYTDSVDNIPVLRRKAEEIRRRTGYDADSHGGKAVRAAIDTYPRDELFQARVEELTPVIESVAAMKERRRVRLFIRKALYGRFVSCLVFLPRERYNTAVRNKIENALMLALGGESIDYQARISESVLARLFFVVQLPEGKQIAEVNLAMLEQTLTACVRTWDDEFMDEAQPIPSQKRGIEFPDAYKNDYRPHQGIQDLAALNALTDHQPMTFALYTPDEPGDPADLRLKIFSDQRNITLSDVMPHLSLLGVDVVDEHPYVVKLRDNEPMIYDFGLGIEGGKSAVPNWKPQDRTRFIAAFEASYHKRAEADSLNALVMGAQLSWQEVSWLRAISKFLQQSGISFAQDYIAQALVANSGIAQQLVTLFKTKFDPSLPYSDAAARNIAVTELEAEIAAALENVESLDHDKIIRRYLEIISAMIRTNAFQDQPEALAFKLLPRKIDFLPEPRPAFEIFVYSPRVEGVHLRYGMVARGGLRWSDRRDDFRTEIMGLVKAQMVKNTVIVPVGAKGGFYPKQLPNPAIDRAGWATEGVACYKIFIAALLSLTDNIVNDKVIAPQKVLRYDEDDPYLVVAADKGTATFSDIANGIAIDKGFWLGDAFASGGSVGYDHKGMGITAKGAWEAVKRHFFEMGSDCQSQDFSCVGIGDMGGDVFGNGMLLSRHIRLVAAFNHLHIFLDPNPDAAASWQERKRMFDERLGWNDYDRALISQGGGIFDRKAKTIVLSNEVKQALGIDQAIMQMTPTELITAILKAPVDLLWNGGIGTYIKASSETHAQVGDKANDALRINGKDLRVRCVGEGGNLGVTQLGRIEYAQTGGRINTDFIDNSAGVDTSDHEVNIKILLANEISAGRLTMAERDELLPQMIDDVATLVLKHNIDQNQTLQNANSRAVAMAGAHEDWMQVLEKAGYLDRAVQFMPSSAEMKKRIGERKGLTNPELCTLLAWTKIKLEDDVLASPLPDDPYLEDRLITYFPPLLQQRYNEVMSKHRLHREIITTEVVNSFVDQQGISAFFRFQEETGAEVADIFRAQMAARGVFKACEHEQEISPEFNAVMQTALRVEIRLMIERATRWMLQTLKTPIDVETVIDEYQSSVNVIKDTMEQLLSGRDAQRYQERLNDYRAHGVSPQLAKVVAGAPFLTMALAIVRTAKRTRRPLITAARTYFALGERLSLDVLLTKVEALPRMNRWDTMSRAALRDDLLSMHSQLTERALSAVLDSDDGDAIVETWWKDVPGLNARAKTLHEIVDGQTTLARMSVGMRTVRSILSSAQ